MNVSKLHKSYSVVLIDPAKLSHQHIPPHGVVIPVDEFLLQNVVKEIDAQHDQQTKENPNR